jgi:PiT family inorganic phosphate transporter
MFANVSPSSPLALGVLVFCFALVLAFEFSNGFHDTANAVATVIYTHSLKPLKAVVLSGTLNFAGVLLGGVAVAYTMVELLPPDVLTPPNGNPAVGMLLAVFLSALIWNVSTWYVGIPCSSSHATIGSLLGISIVSALATSGNLTQGVDWSQVWSVLKALLFSPLLGFVGAAILFRVVQLLIRDRHLFEVTSEQNPPVWWVRALLILTCSGVSFSHGSNDGQKSIGLIMLTIIGIMPAAFSLNFDLTPDQLPKIAAATAEALPLIQRYGDEKRDIAIQNGKLLIDRLNNTKSLSDIPHPERSQVRDAIYRVNAELKAATENREINAADKAKAMQLRSAIHGMVEYAPDWVRLLSATCLGIGTMVGYQRIVRTIGERIGNKPLTPAQGASAELVGAGLIGTAGFSGLPVSTTHIISAGVAGTMAGSGTGVQKRVVWQIIIAWVLTLPATIVLAGGLFWLFTLP